MAGVSRRWAQAALAGIAVYVAIDVALVFLRPEFSVLHNAESDYGSSGHYAWLMDLNFVLRCALTLAAIRALALGAGMEGRRRVGLGLLAVWAVASGLLAFFPDDPVGTKTHGPAKVHLLLAFVAFAAVALGARVTTRALARKVAWRPIVPVLAALSWGAVVPVLLLGKTHLRAHSLGGLWEKVFLAMELLWLAVASAWILRPVPEETPAAAANPA